MRSDGRRRFVDLCCRGDFSLFRDSENELATIEATPIEQNGLASIRGQPGRNWLADVDWSELERTSRGRFPVSHTLPRPILIHLAGPPPALERWSSCLHVRALLPIAMGQVVCRSRDINVTCTIISQVVGLNKVCSALTDLREAGALLIRLEGR